MNSKPRNLKIIIKKKKKCTKAPSLHMLTYYTDNNKCEQVNTELAFPSCENVQNRL